MAEPVYITYFVHGTTADNEQGISSGWSDAKLSVLGVQQSKNLIDMVQDKKFDVVFCSDLQRAIDTTTLAFAGTAPIIIDGRLRECNYGIYNGKPSSIVEPLQEKHTIEPFVEGESYEDVKNRMADFISFLQKNYSGKHVAVVAHKAPQLALDVLLKGKTWPQAFAEDWRLTHAWQPGWEYIIS